MSKLLKNKKGEYNYQFHWIDENGSYTGFNDVWAKDMVQARRKAREMETKAHWSLWNDVTMTYDTVPAEVTGQGHCFRMKGMYIDPKSFKKATGKMSRDMDRLANMITC